MFDFPRFDFTLPKLQNQLEDSEVAEEISECGVKLSYEKTKRPLKRARSLLRLHPETTVLQVLRVQDV